MLQRPAAGEWLERLIDYCRQQGDAAECHAIEIKGPDFSLRPAKNRGSLAKFILGTANRDAQVAQELFQGFAVIVIGVSPSETDGIALIERLDVERAIRPLIGEQGPPWEYYWVPLAPIESQQRGILVLVVAPPPTHGDPFVSEKETEDFRPGQIFVRRDGETSVANPAELRRLFARSKAAPPETICMRVEATAVSVPGLRNSTQFVQGLLNARRRELEGRLPSKSSLRLGAALGIMESRSEEQYLSAIQQWHDAHSNSARINTHELVSCLLPKAILHIENKSERFLEEVEFEISLPAESGVLAYELGAPSALPRILEQTFGNAPEPWGTPMAAILTSQFYSPRTLLNLPAELPSSSCIDWSVRTRTLTIQLGDLRPKAKVALDYEPWALVTNEIPSTPLQWTATARGHHTVFTGEVELTIERSFDLEQEIRNALTHEFKRGRR